MRIATEILIGVAIIGLASYFFMFTPQSTWCTPAGHWTWLLQEGEMTC